MISQASQPELTDRPAPAGKGALRILVVGPLSGDGGLARVARQTAEGFDPVRYDISACDTTKDTSEGRTTIAALGSHVRRWGRLIGALRKHRPHVVHLHTCSYGTFFRTLLDAATCRAFGTPYVLHVHGGLFAEFLDGLSGARRRMANAALRGAARVVVLSPSWRTRLMQLAAGVRLSVVPNALESIRPHDAAFPRGGGILFVGDLSETKRPEDLLVAYAALPAELHRRFPLTIVGGGTALRQRLLSELARRLNVETQVRFAGGLSHADVQAALARADVFALPSRAEGMPLALMEAMAAGAAIVATRVGAIPEMAAAGVEALLVPPRDTHTLASALKMLLTDRELRQRLGNAARQRAVEAFPPQAFRSALATMWSEIARRPTASHTPVPQLATPRHALR